MRTCTQQRLQSNFAGLQSMSIKSIRLAQTTLQDICVWETFDKFIEKTVSSYLQQTTIPREVVQMCQFKKSTQRTCEVEFSS